MTTSHISALLALLLSGLIAPACAGTSQSTLSPIAPTPGGTLPSGIPPPPSGIEPPPSGLEPPPSGLQSPVASAPDADTGLLSRHADAALESLLPGEVAGVTLHTYSLAGDELIGPGNEVQFDAFLGALGKDRADASLATAIDPTGQLAGSLSALEVNGVAPDRVLSAYVAIQRAAPNPPSIEQVTIEGRSLAVMSRPGSPLVQYLLASEESVYIVHANDRATADTLVEALP